MIIFITTQTFLPSLSPRHKIKKDLQLAMLAFSKGFFYVSTLPHYTILLSSKHDKKLLQTGRRPEFRQSKKLNMRSHQLYAAAAGLCTPRHRCPLR